ncbi:polysaccharide deacetylase family protein [Paenibacillus turicensis]|uniref:polysaccharide deacetylase family protein n=1 Tax=Paenibacillus turicensis TaxID=160487 RepID=UPI003D297620
MSYISRVETKKALDKLNAQNKKKKKVVKILGLSLSAIALVFVVFLAIRMLGNNDTVKQEATVVTPKLTAPNESPTKEVDPNSSPNDPNEASKTPTVDDKEKDKDSDKEKNKDIESENGKENNPNNNEATNGINNGSQNSENTNTNNSNTKPITDKDKKGPKTVYLTFDDGPNEHTDTILKILDKYGVHATFFAIGSNLKGNEQALKNTAAAGHYVGLHSMSHNAKKLYKSGSSANFINEFKKEQGLVEDIIGTKPILIRPPYGSAPNINKKFRDDIVKAGFKMWDWTLDSNDWRYPRNPDKIVQVVKKHLTLNTEVILMHEREQTVKVLPQIIEYAQKKGYSFAVYKPEHHLSVNFAKDKRL